MYSDHHQDDYYGQGGYGQSGGQDPYGGYGGGYGGYDQGAYSGAGYDQGAYGGYPQQPGAGAGPGQGYMGGMGAPNIPFNPMIADFAKQYGENLMGQGKAVVDKELQRFVSVSKLKYYFAVDNSYVLKKMGLLFFPFTHKDWSIHYGKNEDDAVQPRFEVNAPDLYIPLMAFITYILVAGLSLGMQQKFSPELLGMQSSSLMGWLILELMIFTGCTYIIQTDLKVLDLLAFCSYKFVGMIFILGSSLVLGKSGFYFTLAYCSLSLSVFLVRTLKKQIYSVTTHEHVISGNKRRLYFLLTLAGVQPLLMWWLTYHLTIW